jgi:hypothetical protein
MRISTRLLALSVFGVCCLYAQPAPVLQIIRETVKEGKGAAHAKTEMEYVRAFRKANFPAHYVALAAMSGGADVLFVGPYESFTQAEQLQKESEKEPLKSEIEMADAHDGALREPSRTMWAVYRPDMSYRADDWEAGKTRFVSVATYRTRPGKESDMRRGAAEIIEAYKKSELPVRFLCYQVIAGAPSGTYLFFEPMESLKPFDEMPTRQKAFREAMGEENFNKLMSGANDMFVYMDNNIYSVNPKMSYVSSKTESSDPAFWRPKTAAPAAKPKPKPAQ